MTAQTKVGAFFIVAIALLGYLTIMVGDLDVPGLAGGRTVRARFPRVDGLEVGDTVTVAGIPSGEVRRMTYADGQVVVEFNLKPEIESPAKVTLYESYFLTTLYRQVVARPAICR